MYLSLVRETETVAMETIIISPGAGILEGFTHFVQYDSNNDYRLDMDEVVRAISRATDEVVESEEIKVSHVSR